MHNSNRLIGWIVIAISILIPVYLWLSIDPSYNHFQNSTAILISFGQFTALIGMMMLSISIFLSARFKWLESLFGDLNHLYIVHEILGGIGTLFILSHPVFLAIYKAQTSVIGGLLYLFPRMNFAATLGSLALWLLVGLVFVTYFVKLRYDIWKKSHQFLGLVLLLGFFHMLLAPGIIMSFLPLRIYMTVWAVAGIVIYQYRTVFASLLVHKYIYVVEGIKPLSNLVWEISLKPKNKPLHFIPGQFIFISFIGKGITPETHPFSISSNPEEKDLVLTIKSLGDFTKHLGEICVGCEAYIEGPFGKFLTDNSDHQIWIAGGIGITPFLSKIQTIRNRRMNVDLYYVVHNESEAIHMPDLLEVAKSNPHFRVTVHITTKDGYLTASMVEKTSGVILNKHIFICGPPAMEKDLYKQFLNLKISPDNLHIEEFAYS
jgi:predicted ferric reductase